MTVKKITVKFKHLEETIINDNKWWWQTHLKSSSEIQGQSVGSGEKAGRKFSSRAKEPLGTDSHRAISKKSSGCWLLIGHKKCFVLLCPIGEQFLMSSFRQFVHDGYCFDHGLSGSFQFDIKSPSDVCPKTKDAFPKIQAWAYNRYSRLHRSCLA